MRIRAVVVGLSLVVPLGVIACAHRDAASRNEAPRAAGDDDVVVVVDAEVDDAPVDPVAHPEALAFEVELTADAADVASGTQTLTGHVQARLLDAAGRPLLVARAGRAARDGRTITLDDGVEVDTVRGEGPAAPLSAWLRGRAVEGEQVTLRARRVTFDEAAQALVVDAPRARGIGRADRRDLEADVAVRRLEVRRDDSGAWRLRAEGVTLSLRRAR